METAYKQSSDRNFGCYCTTMEQLMTMNLTLW